MVGVGSHVGALVSLLRFGYLSTFVYDTFGWLYAMVLKVVFCCWVGQNQVFIEFFCML